MIYTLVISTLVKGIVRIYHYNRLSPHSIELQQISKLVDDLIFFLKQIFFEFIELKEPNIGMCMIALNLLDLMRFYITY